MRRSNDVIRGFVSNRRVKLERIQRYPRPRWSIELTNQLTNYKIRIPLTDPPFSLSLSNRGGRRNRGLSLYAVISVTRNAFHARTKVKVGGQHAVNWSKRVLERSLHRVRSYPASVCCATGPVTVVRSVSPAAMSSRSFSREKHSISHFFTASTPLDEVPSAFFLSVS